MPAELHRQRGLLLGLLAAVEADGRYRALELQCSVARGAGDELSDLDAGLWAADDAWDGAVAAVPALLRGLAPTVDLLERTEAATPYFFAQYEDGTQIDLLVLRASTAKGRVPTAVVLFDPDGLLAEPWTPASLEASAAEVREWSFLAWLALSNLDKYLRRGSLWEARAQLEDARTNLLRLHATRLAVPFPASGSRASWTTSAPRSHTGSTRRWRRSTPATSGARASRSLTCSRATSRRRSRGSCAHGSRRQSDIRPA